MWEGRGQSQKPSHRGRGARECLEFVCLAPCVGKRGGKEVKETSPDIEGQPETKIPKIPIVVYILGSQTIPVILVLVLVRNSYCSRCFWEVETTPVILHGSRYTTKLKKKSYNYTLLLMIVNILCYKCNIIVYKCNVSRETTTQLTNVNKRGKEKRTGMDKRNTNVTYYRCKKN